MAWGETQNVEISLEPRSSCGFYLYSYNSYLDITFEYPVTLYNRYYKTIKFNEVEYLVKESSESGFYPGNNCMTQICNNFFHVYDGKQYFLIVNWDFDSSQTVNIEIYDKAGIYEQPLGATALSVFSAAGTVLAA
eukprot:CAMPEP_0170493034 /NCGR_PEP_ID=MMETSP0208-20121228/13255_1 /TAXON_ID=197538 /ORGANISM="Strombidium inclinatum, Strain S3" /LENGTH=134 /DNA_ID=CAMNT_0010768891 /DNA_START=284 /DNA_END=684 /DNA_ORIENTATION=+